MDDEDRALPTSGAKWRVKLMSSTGAKDLIGDGVFDELVVGNWLHVEWMDDETWWMRIGDMRVTVDVRDDSVGVSVERGVYGEVVEAIQSEGQGSDD